VAERAANFFAFVQFETCMMHEPSVLDGLRAPSREPA